MDPSLKPVEGTIAHVRAPCSIWEETCWPWYSRPTVFYSECALLQALRAMREAAWCHDLVMGLVSVKPGPNASTGEGALLVGGLPQVPLES